jgi:hypothetical protein
MKKEILKAFVSSKNEAFETPQALFDELNKHYDFICDLAATVKNKKCDFHFADIFDLEDEKKLSHLCGLNSEE